MSFLKEQISPKNNPAFDKTLQIQIETLRSTDTERVAHVILRKKTELERSRDLAEIEMIHSEIEALECLRWEVAGHDK